MKMLGVTPPISTDPPKDTDIKSSDGRLLVWPRAWCCPSLTDGNVL